MISIESDKENTNGLLVNKDSEEENKRAYSKTIFLS